jgi:hypothetical protein
MSNKLSRILAKAIASGLSRQAVQTCARWAEKYRVMGDPFPGPFTFDHHPWLLDMHLCEDTHIVSQKAAQMGCTEWALNRTFYEMDIHNRDVLYLLPTSSDASDFSSGRFDPALAMSPHLKNFFYDVDNKGLKRAGSKILYVRGSHSRSKLKSIPASVLVYDEIDEMPPESVELARERQSGQLYTLILMLSTPSINGCGINKEFNLSTESYFHFKCPSCGKYIQLSYPESLHVCGDSLTDPNISKSYLKCHLCDNPLPVDTSNGGATKPWLKHKLRGGTAHMVPSYTQRPSTGFHISQLYSMAKAGQPAALATAAIKAKLDPTSAQEWYNSKLGIPFIAPGAKVKDDHFHIGTYLQRTVNMNHFRTLGCDVGSKLHAVVREWEQIETFGLSVSDRYIPRIVFAGTFDRFEEVGNLFRELNCSAGVVDSEPERRAALQFAQTFFGRILLCDYQYGQRGREVRIDEDELLITVNRTSWMDLTFSRYKNGTMLLPQDLPNDFRSHIKEPTRILRQDKWGNHYAVYVNARADHYAHADNYAEIALPLAVGLGQAVSITDMY